MRKRQDLEVFAGPIPDMGKVNKQRDKSREEKKKKGGATFAAVVVFFLPVILLFLFFSSNPRPNILISDLAGFVEAKNEATKMNLDILGRDLRIFVVPDPPSSFLDCG